jgi:predicted amidohydrolase
MTRALILPENQVRAIMRAARKEGVRVEVKIGGAIVTVIPDDSAQDERPIAPEKDIRL